MFYIITNTTNDVKCVGQYLPLKSAITLALEKNCDVCDTGPLLIFVCGLMKTFKMKKEKGLRQDKLGL